MWKRIALKEPGKMRNKVDFDSDKEAHTLQQNQSNEDKCKGELLG